MLTTAAFAMPIQGTIIIVAVEIALMFLMVPTPLMIVGYAIPMQVTTTPPAFKIVSVHGAVVRR